MLQQKIEKTQTVIGVVARQSIVEVSGYVLISHNKFYSFDLSQLRLIRGEQLFNNKYSLAIFSNQNLDGLG